TLLACLVDLHGDLIGRPADALRTNLDRGLDVLDGLGEDIDGFGIAHALLDLVHGAVEDALSGGLLTLPHQAVDELAGEPRVIARVSFECICAGGAFSSHGRSPAD